MNEVIRAVMNEATVGPFPRDRYPETLLKDATENFLISKYKSKKN